MRKLIPVSLAIVFIALTCLISIWGCESSSVGNQKDGAIILESPCQCLIPNGRNSAWIRATILDGAGVAVQVGTDVVFRTDLGTFANGDKVYHTKTINSQNGSALVSLIAGFTSGTATVEARANGIRQSIWIEITEECGGDCQLPTVEVPPEEEELPASIIEPSSIASGMITLESSDITVTNGSGSAVITATIVDSNGQPVAVGTPVTFSTSEGTFANGEKSYSTTTADESGTVQARLYPDEGNAIATVLCTSGDLSATIAVGFEDY
jgi:hypothetical protein